MPRLSLFFTGLSLSLISLTPLPAQLIPRKPAQAPQTVPSVTPTPAPSPARPLKEEDVDRLLRQLSEIQDDLQGKRSTYNNSLLSQLKEAGNSEEKSFQLWMDGTKEFEFDERGKTSTEFAEWKRTRGKEMHGNTPFMTSLRLQTRYLSVLILSSNARTEASKAEAITATVAYLEDLAGSAKKLDGQMEELNRSVLDSVIAKHLKLDNSLAKVKDSGGKNDRNDAYRPGNVSEIYERAIFPYYRDKGQVSALVAAWQKLISQETAMVEAAKVPEKTETFNRERLPVLKWGMAREMFNAGQEDTAMAAMLGLIKTNLGNRNAAGWISEMSGLLKNKKEQSLVSSTPPAPAAVPASSVTSPSIPPSPAPAVKTVPAAVKDKAPVLNPFENAEFDPIPMPGDPPAQSSVSPGGKKTSGPGSRAS